MGVVVTTWKYNVDGLMIEGGALAGFFPSPVLLTSDFYPSATIATLLLLLKIFFVSPALVLIIQIFIRPKVERSVHGMFWFFRVLVIWLAFIVPSLLAIYLPLNIATDFSRYAGLNMMQSQLLSDRSQIVIEDITKTTQVTQSFVSGSNNLSALSLQVATHGRQSSSVLKFTVTDQAGQVIHTEDVEAVFLEDNSWFALRFDPQPSSAGKTYNLSISSDGLPGDSITAYMSVEDSILDGVLEVNGQQQPGDLSIILYFTSPVG
jgi:hypothetical protein